MHLADLLLLQDVLNRRLLFPKTNQAVAPKPSPIISSFGIGRRSFNGRKICGGAENVVKTEAQQTFVNGLLVLYFRHLYSAGSACVLLTIIA